MHSINGKLINLPNFISIIRILMAPVLFYFALTQQPFWFLCVLIFTAFTDVLDGFVARSLHQITALGAHLDSWGDFIIYSTSAICAWILWPEIVLREWYYCLMIVLSFTLPVVVGLIKFHTLTSYHTWSVKLAVAATVIGYFLLFSELLDWPFKLAAMLCLYAAAEEIAITLLLRNERTDIRTVWKAIKLRDKHQCGE